MDHDPEFVAVFPNTDGLTSVSALPDEGTAPGMSKNRLRIRVGTSVPAGSFREDYIVGMFIPVPFHELDTGEVLPVAHGLFE